MPTAAVLCAALGGNRCSTARMLGVIQEVLVSEKRWLYLVCEAVVVDLGPTGGPTLKSSLHVYYSLGFLGLDLLCSGPSAQRYSFVLSWKRQAPQTGTIFVPFRAFFSRVFDLLVDVRHRLLHTTVS